ncbi:hypothetical protein EJD97_010036, partial [Solanum chilense]
AQVSEKQFQHVPREYPTVEARDIQDQVDQETQNSEENDLSGELGPVTQKNKRGSTVMQSVHGRKERNMIFRKVQNYGLWMELRMLVAKTLYKNELYRKHYKSYDNDDLRMANKPKDVSKSDFKDFFKYWASEKFKVRFIFQVLI